MQRTTKPQRGHIDSTLHFPLRGTDLSDMVEHRDFDTFQRLGGVKGICSSLNVDEKAGISDETISQRVQQYGNNLLPPAERQSFFEIWKEALSDQTLLILIASAVVSLILAAIVPHAKRECPNIVDMEGGSDYYEGFAILTAVLAVSLIGAWNDYSKQSKFIEIAERETDCSVKILRNGIPTESTSSQLVVGDIVFLSVGDVLPADGVFLKGSGIRIDESEMTGESVACKKSEENFVCLSGCTVTDGTGAMVVVAVGQNSQWGKLKAYVNKDKQRPTPLQERLDDLAELIGKMGMLCAGVVFVVLSLWWFYKAVTFNGYVLKGDHCKLCDPKVDGDKCDPANFNWWRITDLVDYFIIAVTIVVVAVPEGLPLAVTVSLAYSMKQMCKDNNLVRHLKACETMSNATCICCDKTGTLTENRMNVTAIWVDNNSIEVTADFHLPAEIQKALTMNASLNSSLSSNITTDNKTIGNKTECALLLLLKKLGVSCSTIRTSYEISRQWVFTSESKRMDTIVDNVLYSKGAPEMIIADCVNYLNSNNEEVDLTEEHRQDINECVNNWFSLGKRVIALSYRHLKPEESERKDLQERISGQESTLICVVAISDPVRYEVPGAIENCVEAGISVKMVTGDHVSTAISIAKECGIVHECEIYDGKSDVASSEIAMEGKYFSELDNTTLDRVLPRLKILARCSPQDKQRLVERLLISGEVVAVTGDGTNDVPAFKEADVALAMGLRGTDVAKQAADIVILDDNFNSIVKAVVWGRCVYDNIRKFIQFQVTVNISALALCVIGSICQMGSPLNSMQMLWVNLIMDTLAALALGTEKPTMELLKRKPFKRTDGLLSKQMIIKIAIQVVYQLFILLTLLFFGSLMSIINAPCGYMSVIEDYPGKLYQCSDGKAHPVDDVIEDTKTLQTIIFNTFVFCQIFNEVNSRRVNGETDVFKGIFTNTIFIGIELVQILVQIGIVVFSGATFGVKSSPGIGFVQWIICIALALVTLPLGLLNGVFNKRKVRMDDVFEVEMKSPEQKSQPEITESEKHKNETVHLGDDTQFEFSE
ncbi:cation-transporting ATPase, putative [Entamoeba invadens IP1]|uniref:Calcium-transporting ATPase n=1 Tax=Entamoeba invadens IP1 TaxID=370355 RepID=A0A0A1U714_ENTIV|nr:cation-transporting ATPase, putative [Entamoeba invadens IP1]ELP90177.1 cation-transporting ATPase, putative [Entamoeba invadens IP1]|eukprot:XP_004256948.1 cation-transporting ATPase, putative [Entamoeba invadens IP1]